MSKQFTFHKRTKEKKNDRNYNYYHPLNYLNTEQGKIAT